MLLVELDPIRAVLRVSRGPDGVPLHDLPQLVEFCLGRFERGSLAEPTDLVAVARLPCLQLRFGSLGRKRLQIVSHGKVVLVGQLSQAAQAFLIGRFAVVELSLGSQADDELSGRCVSARARLATAATIRAAVAADVLIRFIRMSLLLAFVGSGTAATIAACPANASSVRDAQAVGSRTER